MPIPEHADTDVISGPCWDGRHERCTGWMVVSSDNFQGGRSVRCLCHVCVHPPVPPDRHLHEDPQPGLPWPKGE